MIADQHIFYLFAGYNSDTGHPQIIELVRELQLDGVFQVTSAKVYQSDVLQKKEEAISKMKQKHDPNSGAILDIEFPISVGDYKAFVSEMTKGNLRVFSSFNVSMDQAIQSEVLEDLEYP